MATAEKKVYSVQEVAQIMNVAECTVYGMISSGRLGYCKMGRSVRIPAKEMKRILTPQYGRTATSAAIDKSAVEKPAQETENVQLSLTPPEGAPQKKRNPAKEGDRVHRGKYVVKTVAIPLTKEQYAYLLKTTSEETLRSGKHGESSSIAGYIRKLIDADKAAHEEDENEHPRSYQGTGSGVEPLQ